MVCLYYTRCGIYCVNLEACGEDQSPSGAATIVKSMKSEKPKWGSTDSEIDAKYKGPSVASVIVRSMQTESPGGAASTMRLVQQVYQS